MEKGWTELMRLLSITSGSSGNCIYVGSDNTHILIDAGISGKRIEAGLCEADITGHDLSGILVTHEHSDHIASIGVMARRYNVPIYATKGTIEGIIASPSTGIIDESLFRIIDANNQFDIGDLCIYPQRVSHDASDPVAYRIGHNKKSVGVCTDLGVYDKTIVDTFYGVNALLLEANHDVNMLSVGRYPYSLKRRILGERGHLSNETAGRLLCELMHDDLDTVLLGHLSAENNLPELAYESVRLEILMNCRDYNPTDINLKVASRSECSEIVNI